MHLVMALLSVGVVHVHRYLFLERGGRGGFTSWKSREERAQIAGLRVGTVSKTSTAIASLVRPSWSVSCTTRRRDQSLTCCVT